MKLLVPTTFRPEFLEALRGTAAGSVYGALPDDPGMRPKTWIPSVDEAAMAEHIAQARSLGMEFVYTFNASCLGQREFSAEGQRWLAEKIGQWQDLGVKHVTLANPYVAQMVRERAPEIRLHISIVANIDTTNKAQFWEQMGAYSLYVHPNVNRDLRFIKALRQAVRCELTMLVNEGCLLQCPIREYHANLASHFGEALQGGYFMDYPSARCAAIKIATPAQLLKSPWVLPQDLGVYEELGIDTFKLAGRDKSPAWILRAVEAYSSRKYEGNLVDLISGFNDLDRVGGPVGLHIDTRRLDGFLRGFETMDCRRGCGSCRYCDTWAQRAVQLEPEVQEHYVAQVEGALERLARGTFRPRLAGSGVGGVCGPEV